MEIIAAFSFGLVLGALLSHFYIKKAVSVYEDIVSIQRDLADWRANIRADVERMKAAYELLKDKK